MSAMSFLSFIFQAPEQESVPHLSSYTSPEAMLREFSVIETRHKNIDAAEFNRDENYKQCLSQV